MRSAIERRQVRRAELEAPVTIRSLDQASIQLTGQAKNVSLAGVYCLIPAPCPLKPGEQVACSVVIPEGHARTFPFRRVTGQGWVVRAGPIQMGRRTGESPTSERLVGVAVAFAPDVTALGTVWER